MHQKVNMLIFLKRMPKKGIFKNNSSLKVGHSLVFSCLHLLFPKKNSLKSYYNIIFLPWALEFLSEHLFGLSKHKPRWTMSMDDIGLKIHFLGTSNSMITLMFFP
jgi:hypothetical protein